MNRILRCLFVLLCLSAVHAADSPIRPNVLFIAIDDLKPALGCYGDAHASTPNLDRLASRSLRFEHAYCNQAVCGPSRNAMMTSLRPQTLGIYDLSTNFRESRPDAITLPQHFLNQGYHTSSMGKILHTGHGNHEDPASWSEKPVHPKVDYYALPENRPSDHDGGSRGAGVYGAATESADVPDDTYSDGILAAEAVKRLAVLKSANAPFFFAVGFRCPHLPFVAPKKYWDRIDAAKLPLPASDALPQGAPEAAGPNTDELRKYKNIPQGKAVLSEAQKRLILHGYYAASSYVDACVGRVLDALESNGLADNTIVVVWGDHGYHLGEHGIWGKHTNFEVAARIPLLVALPGKAGAVTSALVETVDIYPTLAELARLPAPPNIDGRSFASLFSTPAKAHREFVNHIYPRGNLLGNAVRNDRYRLVEWSKPEAKSGTGVMELYDYQTDPGESVNLAAAQPAVVAELKAILANQPALKAQIRSKAATTEKPVDGKQKTDASDRAAQFHKMDKNNDAKVTYDEFAARQRDLSDAPQRFRKLDSNGDNGLTEIEYVNKGARSVPSQPVPSL
ncbi:MAG: sulfatase-like hydrolase/transferase [Verrucomicrobiaceae bacterium]|nr:sulfatase-like hydrolase/transferase [Verrucomicrobiaceae bacterium]